jgi:hypothetical protein
MTMRSRVRVRLGPDGYVYLLTDLPNGGMLRPVPPADRRDARGALRQRLPKGAV